MRHSSSTKLEPVRDHVLIVGSKARLAKPLIDLYLRFGARVSGLDIASSSATLDRDGIFNEVLLEDESEGTLAACISLIVKNYGAVTHLIFMARPSKSQAGDEAEELTRLVGTAFRQPTQTVELLAFLPQNRQSLKSVLFFGSPLAKFASAHQDLGYHFAKGGQSSLSRALALTYGKLGIRVNLVTPGFVRVKNSTPNEGGVGVLDPELNGQMLQQPLSSEDVAKAAYLLGSDFASGITGQELFVDAGTSSIEMLSALDRRISRPNRIKEYE